MNLKVRVLVVVLLVEILDESVPKVNFGRFADVVGVPFGLGPLVVRSRRIDACTPFGGRGSRAEEDDVSRARKGFVSAHNLTTADGRITDLYRTPLIFADMKILTRCWYVLSS